ncbi:MAG: hypothetical protein Q8O95_01265 [bacterium]|nr:hypothetical protein [bacterium]
MKKRLRRSVTALLVVVTMGLGMMETAFALDTFGDINSAADAVRCAEVGNTDCDCILQGISTDTVQVTDDIIVFLTEGIATPEQGKDEQGKEYSCSRVIECLREDVGKNNKEITKAQLEGTVGVILQSKFSQCVVVGKTGLDLLNNYATLVYRWIAGIVGSICILVVIISGIQISIGGLSQEEVSSAKDRILRSLVGLVVLFLSAFILYTINPIFFI